MEQYHFLKKEEGQLSGRSYIGHISCPGFLKDYSWMLRLKDPLTLVLPPMPERYFASAMALVAALSSRKGLECSVNDFGLLTEIARSFPQISLSAGPMLFPQDTDPLISRFCRETELHRQVWAGEEPAHLRWKAPSEACLHHWREPSAFTAWRFLQELGVSRLEICTQPLMPREIPPLPVSLYGGSILSVLPCKSCDRCENLPTPLRSRKILHHDKNLVWYEPEDCFPSFADRLILFEKQEKGK